MRCLARVCRRVLSFAPLVALTACGFDSHGFLASAGPVAQAQRYHFFAIIGWVLIVIVPLFVALPIVLWKYRIGRKAVYRPNWSHSLILEVLIWGIPIAVVGVLSWQLVPMSHKLDPYAPIKSDKPALNIQAVSFDWKWLFIYPKQNVATVNELVLPVNRPISFHLTSATVMQSFFIPRLGSQIYAMPGSVSRLHLLGDEPGRYRGLNTQYNGKHFAKQSFTVHVVKPARFRQWIGQQQSKPPLDHSAYARIARRSVFPSPETYGGTPPHLFQTIIAQVENTPASEMPWAESKKGG